MNGRERLMRIFQGKDVDRPALKLWGLEVDQEMLHPSYKPVYDLAMEVSDIMAGASSRFDILLGQNAANKEFVSVEDKPLPGGNWIDRYTYMYLNGKKLRSIYRYSTKGEPGYEMEYPVKEPDDLTALLNAEYLPFPVDMTSYNEAMQKVGDKGIAVFYVDHAAYAVSRIMGSERFALMCIDERDLIKEAVNIFASRIRDHVKAVLDTGTAPVFGWVGPELCIPPLVRMNEFEELVFDVDKELCDMIHNSGGYVWVHCHGRVKNVIKKFMDMGVDVLNPLEPAPLGDISIKEAVEIVGSGMGLEGNIEISSLLLDKPERIKELIYSAVSEGKETNRFILCPSAGYMEYVNPSPQYIDNLLLYLKYGLECILRL